MGLLFLFNFVSNFLLLVVGFWWGRRPITKNKKAVRALARRMNFCLDQGTFDRGEIARWRDALNILAGELENYVEPQPKN